MRNLTKLEKPAVLEENEVEWLAQWLADKASNLMKFRYRHPDIKQTLVAETGWKCVYCESKIGHNTPGDIEHKVPSSKQEALHFAWENLTVACAECNRRKNDFYNPNAPFIDPYIDDAESMVVHIGPIATWRLGDARSEQAVRMLDLHSHARVALVARKIELIHSTCHLLERIHQEQDPSLKALHLHDLAGLTRSDAEYSAMIVALLRVKGINS